LLAARAVGEGGAGLAAFKMAVNQLKAGASLEIFIGDHLAFFGEGAVAFLVAIKPENLTLIMDHARQLGVTFEVAAKISKAKSHQANHGLGTVTTYFGVLSVEDLLAEFEGFLPAGAK
jgi:hypothetical protein